MADLQRLRLPRAEPDEPEREQREHQVEDELGREAPRLRDRVVALVTGPAAQRDVLAREREQQEVVEERVLRAAEKLTEEHDTRGEREPVPGDDAEHAPSQIGADAHRRLGVELAGHERPEQQEARDHEEHRDADVHALEDGLEPAGKVRLHPRAGREGRVHDQHHRHPEEAERVEAGKVERSARLEAGGADLRRRCLLTRGHVTPVVRVPRRRARPLRGTPLRRSPTRRRGVRRRCSRPRASP